MNKKKQTLKTHLLKKFAAQVIVLFLTSYRKFHSSAGVIGRMATIRRPRRAFLCMGVCLRSWMMIEFPDQRGQMVIERALRVGPAL